MVAVEANDYNERHIAVLQYAAEALENRRTRHSNIIVLW
jgi:hypothetical protein